MTTDAHQPDQLISELPARVEQPAMKLPALAYELNALGTLRLYSLARVSKELNTLLPRAMTEAIARFNAIITAQDALSEVIEDAHAQVAFLRHSRGPRFQVSLLAEIGHAKIKVITVPYHSALERVRTFSFAISAALAEHPPEVVESATHLICQPVISQDIVAAHHALAEMFLANTSDGNRADPRFAALQELIDARTDEAAYVSSGNWRPVRAAQEKAVVEIAKRIREGEFDYITGPQSRGVA